jgi:hypothetical protein
VGSRRQGGAGDAGEPHGEGDRRPARRALAADHAGPCCCVAQRQRAGAGRRGERPQRWAAGRCQRRPDGGRRLPAAGTDACTTTSPRVGPARDGHGGASPRPDHQQHRRPRHGSGLREELRGAGGGSDPHRHGPKPASGGRPQHAEAQEGSQRAHPIGQRCLRRPERADPRAAASHPGRDQHSRPERSGWLAHGAGSRCCRSDRGGSGRARHGRCAGDSVFRCRFQGAAAASAIGRGSAPRRHDGTGSTAGPGRARRHARADPEGRARQGDGPEESRRDRDRVERHGRRQGHGPPWRCLCSPAARHRERPEGARHLLGGGEGAKPRSAEHEVLPAEHREGGRGRRHRGPERRSARVHPGAAAARRREGVGQRQRHHADAVAGQVREPDRHATRPGGSRHRCGPGDARKRLPQQAHERGRHSRGCREPGRRAGDGAGQGPLSPRACDEARHGRLPEARDGVRPERRSSHLAVQGDPRSRCPRKAFAQELIKQDPTIPERIRKLEELGAL